MIPESFLEQVRQRPLAPAVRQDGTVVTYQELAGAAWGVARGLAARGVRAESPVGVLVSPGPHLVAALLGIWLAGGAYVPLDPLAPARRRREVLAQAGARIVLTDGSDEPDEPPATEAAQFPPGTRSCGVGRLIGAGDGIELPGRVTGPRQAAYLIFTSGSTGTPKGVVVEHAAIANRVHWGIRALKLSPDDRVLQKTPLTFDAAGWEIFAPLLCGAAVTFGRPEAGRDARELVRSVREQRATVLQVVPSLLRLLAVEPDLGRCDSLRLVCCAGEALHAELCQRVRDRIDVEIVNTYGPTECAIDALAGPFDPAQEHGPVPIGRPIDNLRQLLLPPPAGTGADESVRELYLCGAGVGRGYHGDAAQTAERFLPDPDGPPGSRMYRTGDLVRVRPDGALEFVGRIDAQVKINGVRIEPGEVEAVLETHPDVIEAAVRAVTDPHGTRRLAAWVVTSHEVAVDGLLDQLRDRLPPSAVPAYLSRLATLPRTASGKTDRSRLPDPDWAGPAPRSADPPKPDGAAEQIVVAAWRRLLDVDEVGPADDFYRLGGHSLLMTRLLATLRDLSGLDLDFRELNLATTVREQADLLRRAQRAQPIERLPANARLPLSYAQERFWVLDRMHPGSPEYLHPMLVRLAGDTGPAVVRAALAHLMARHDVLRTGYRMDADGLRAVIEPAPEVPLRTVQTTPAEIGAVVATELGTGFDLTTAPLFRATLVRDGGTQQLLLLVYHHIVCDGWSTRILADELRETIAALGQGRPADLPELPIRYCDAVGWLRSRLTEETLAEQIGYWRRTLAGLPPLDLPISGERPRQRSISGGAVRLEIPATDVRALLEIGRQAGATPYVVCLTLWIVLLGNAGGGWDFGVGAPHSGRTRPELHDLVGLFIDVVVIRARLTPELSFVEALTRVERTCREGLAHQAAPFEAVADALVQPRDPGRTPLFQTMVSMAGDGLVGQRWQPADLDLLAQAWTVARTDLALTVWPQPDGRYLGAIEYASALYDRATAATLADRLGELAGRFAADPALPVGAAGPVAAAPAASAGHPDRAAVAAPAPPLAPHQEKILGFIRELLGRDDIGADDDILRHGGNSLLAARLLWNIQSVFGVELPMRAFFDRPTAAGLGAEVERLIHAEFDSTGYDSEG
ncbi:amino acid adenylation domain-containing protein [Solwaraspora sp. WMMD1047]|uniref:amino acid adenylation domain-containing protein n=1 Tax=Solwaraspora sp. WMMD1047 TaxID=3016102 RepID=UPI002416B49A|nr:amino acid adenylation domain-containing protein [Solwaraspora sp. WMMD1047]MDG4830658.1 amino acid adenylation domain-containing protein [Solwaraspora sp. WMMD1047]